jgi:hypothetical protein
MRPWFGTQTGGDGVAAEALEPVRVRRHGDNGARGTVWCVCLRRKWDDGMEESAYLEPAQGSPANPCRLRRWPSSLAEGKPAQENESPTAKYFIRYRGLYINTWIAIYVKPPKLDRDP